MHAILNRTQAEEAISSARSRLLSLAPLAVSRLEQALASPKHDGVEAAAMILKGLGVLVERSKAEINITKNDFEGWTDEQLECFIADEEPQTSKPN